MELLRKRLRQGIEYGYMDLTNIINGAFALLDYTNGFDTSIRSLFDNLESLAGYILLEMGVKPFLSSVGEDSMWLLLICDLSIYQAVADTQILMNQEISS
nr:putative E3 ubiquitin-protein ligase RF4 [Ipomoea trifida]